MDLTLLIRKKSIIIIFCVASVIYGTAIGALILLQDKLLFHPRPRGAARPTDYGIANYKEVTTDVGAGQTTVLWWIPTKSEAPTLLYCHGNSASISSSSEAAGIFHGYGWNTLLFEYRGYGGVPAPREGLSERSLQADARAAWRWLMAQGVAPHSVIIWGYSLGSSICAALAAEQQSALLVLEGAFPSIEHMAAHRYPWALVPSFAFRNKLATATYAKSSRSPILIIHGQDDRVVPFYLGRALFESLPATTQFLDLGAADHTDFPRVHKQFDDKLLAIVTEALQATQGDTIKQD